MNSGKMETNQNQHDTCQIEASSTLQQVIFDRWRKILLARNYTVQCMSKKIKTKLDK